ncbi:Histidine kinase-, DNA gyrase B-, and HSP90-like ATPase [Halorubrum aquaticum]|uniref:histidine kinase n=1 Tax=Halorubrum aquaticum TaxID=387340 RepID=A0A1I3CNW5_9EURY|nr:ATP-binding protein [Halorubrum aquaticum]SFH76202.1 Histidine kinase-, DNA gyrase B-, and HSP90-like ATPase [Halorubrum aquaticum]
MWRPRGYAVVVGIGCSLLLAATVHHGTEIGAVEGALGPALALTLDGGIALGVVYAGGRVRDAGFTRDEEGRVARWTAAGTFLAAGAIGATLLVRAVEGRPLVEPVFPLLVAAGSGALGGAIAGYLAVRQEAEARRARDATRAVSFVNHLLRHDLRNDLSTIRGYADLAGSTGHGDGNTTGERGDDGNSDDGNGPGGRDASTVIAAKADEGLDRLETTSAVTDALLGDSDLHRVDLAAITREILEGLTERTDVTVEADLTGEAPVTANDGLRSVVDNLVENAVEHAGGDVTLRVAVRDDDGTVTLSVGDDGPGIPPERRAALFGDDDAGDAAAEGAGDRDGGTGSGGLFIVDSLVEEYGGTVSVGDADLGGTRFEVRLPRADDD